MQGMNNASSGPVVKFRVISATDGLMHIHRDGCRHRLPENGSSVVSIRKRADDEPMTSLSSRARIEVQDGMNADLTANGEEPQWGSEHFHVASCAKTARKKAAPAATKSEEDTNMPTATSNRRGKRKPAASTKPAAEKATKADAEAEATEAKKPGRRPQIELTDELLDKVQADREAKRPWHEIEAETGVSGNRLRPALAERAGSGRIEPIKGTGQVLAKRVAEARRTGHGWYHVELATGKKASDLKELLKEHGFGELTGRVYAEPKPKEKKAKSTSTTKGTKRRSGGAKTEVADPSEEG